MSGIIAVQYQGKKYRAYISGTVKVWYSEFGDSGWDTLGRHEISTIEAVQKLARETEEGRAWGELSPSALRFTPSRTVLDSPMNRRFKPRRYGASRRLYAR